MRYLRLSLIALVLVLGACRRHWIEHVYYKKNVSDQQCRTDCVKIKDIRGVFKVHPDHKMDGSLYITVFMDERKVYNAGTIIEGMGYNKVRNQ